MLQVFSTNVEPTPCSFLENSKSTRSKVHHQQLRRSSGNRQPSVKKMSEPAQGNQSHRVAPVTAKDSGRPECQPDRNHHRTDRKRQFVASCRDKSTDFCGSPGPETLIPHILSRTMRRVQMPSRILRRRERRYPRSCRIVGDLYTWVAYLVKIRDPVERPIILPGKFDSSRQNIMRSELACQQ